MKLSVERSYLLKAISQAQSVVERRNTIPILSNVLIELRRYSKFRATDLDMRCDKALLKLNKRAQRQFQP